MSELSLDSPVRALRGVGPRKAGALESLGVKTIGDLLFLFPRRYEDRRGATPLRELQSKLGTTTAVVAEVFSVSTVVPIAAQGSNVPCSVVLTDGDCMVRAVWFNPYATRTLRPGMRVVLYGRVEYYGGIQLNNPEFEILGKNQEPSLIGRIFPIYPATSVLTQKFLTELLGRVLDDWSQNLVDFLPENIREHYHMKNLREAVLELHRPQSLDSQLRARNRLAFDELFLLQLGLLIRRQRINTALSVLSNRNTDASNCGNANSDNGDSTSANRISLVPGECYAHFRENLPFILTGAQIRAIGEILNDLGKSFPMNRLLQGDVGSGKTIVAVAALLVAVDSGAQVAFMAPTSILAQQHFIKIEKILKPLGVKTALLTGGSRTKERQKRINDIREGRIQVVIGTHALFSEGVDFAHLGLVIVDEQHRFGVVQRGALFSKGMAPHTLIMTATPIPRTLVLSIYGDLTVSMLDEMPPDRKTVKTYAVTPINENYVLDRVRERVRQRQQGYWVCPLIEPSPSNEPSSYEDYDADETETSDLSAVTSTFERLKEILPDVRIAMLHGRLPITEKSEIMERFSHHEIDLLVATTVIEVGVDVPNATIMIVQDASRFGLAQLHQLRGRVGRGEEASECFLLYGNTPSQNGVRRISTMVKTFDGFALAEADLQLRGPGAVCGVRQHGVTDFRVADLSRDLKILELARREAQNLLAEDPDLQHEPELKVELTRRFGERLEIAGIA